MGVGYELAYAEKINKPVIILHRKAETKLSAVINGTDYFKNVNYYSSLVDAERTLKTRLNELIKKSISFVNVYAYKLVINN